MQRHQTLKLSVAGLDEAGLDLSLNLDQIWFANWREEDPSLDFTAPQGLDVRLRVQKHHRDILVRGHLSGEVELSCSRCLATFSQPLKGDFDLLLAPGPGPVSSKEEELSAADLDLDFYSGDEIDLEIILREQILLLLPLKALCAEECRGLCPHCGAELNRAPCTCPAEAPASPFAALAEKMKKA